MEKAEFLQNGYQEDRAQEGQAVLSHMPEMARIEEQLQEACTFHRPLLLLSKPTNAEVMYVMQIRAVHDGEKNYKCTVCTKEFFGKNGLDRHMRLTHITGRMHICLFCTPTSFGSTSKGQLTRHMKEQHRYGE